MKKYLTLFTTGIILILSSCATNSDIDNLQSQIDGLKSGQIATIESQINSITGSITSLQEADREIKGYISVLQNTATELQKSINSADGKIDDLEKALAIVNTAIDNLKAKDSALEQRISDLKDYVDTQLRGAKDWVSATFATLEQYNGIVSEIGGIKGSISSINTAMEQMESRLNGKITLMKGEIEEAYTKAIGALESSLKNWVNEQLEGYWTIAETEGKLETLEGNLAKEDESIREDIGKLRASLDSAKNELTDGYKAAIKSAIETNNGVLDGKLSEAVSGLNTRIDGEVSTINKRIGKLEKRVLDLESAVSKLLSRIQSLSYIPRYDDGASTMWYQTFSQDSFIARDTLDFRVSPADCADSLVKVWDKAVSAEAVSVNTRGAQQIVTLPVVSVTGGNGKISVVLDGSPLDEKFFSGKQKMKVVVIISDGNNELTSDYISMVAKEDTSIPNNVICYTSNNGEILVPFRVDDFGANIISNEYRGGRGILCFDGDITGIGGSAFQNCTELTSILIPNSVKSIGGSAFFNCSGLTSIIIPNSVTSIGNSAFAGCSGLESIEIPKSVTVIENGAFASAGLTSIKLPDSLTIISGDVFNNCEKLVSVQIPGSVTSIERQAFYNCSSLSSIEIPSSVTSIGFCPFGGCKRLASIKVNTSNPTYDSRNNCNAIIETKSNTLITGCKTTFIPNSVTSIGDRAFLYCSELTAIEIPNTVTIISDYAFQGCYKLESISIPSSVRKIGLNAFRWCSCLRSISALAISPCKIDPGAFEGTSNCPIYVPRGSVESYKVAEGWSQYADRIQAIPYGKYDSNVTWTLGSNAYTQEANVNEISGVQVLKFGTSAKAGEATIVLPKGTKSLSFYGVSWKGNPATVQFSLGETVLYAQALAANDGACNNPPYTITVTDSDHYTMALPQTLTEDVSVTVTTTVGGKTRIMLFGIKAE